MAAVGADRVLIGAPGDSNYVGAAYLFDLAGTLVTTFTNPAPATSDSFGIAVAALGTNRVVIGASGAAYLFDLAGNLITSFTDPVTQYGSGFGKSLAAVGDNRVLIGASEDNTIAPLAGIAYLFSSNGALLATFANPTPAAEDKFGSSLAAVGSQWVVIGAYRDDTGALNAGAAYLFRTDGTHVGTLTSPTPAANASFGYSVAAAGADRVLIGAFGYNTGTAYLFTLDSFIPGFIAAGVRPGAVDSAGLTAGAVQSANIASGAVGSTQIADGAIGSTQLDPTIGLWTASGADVYRGGTGKVGIGTDAPTTALDVAGAVTATAFSGDGTGLTGVPVGAGAVGSIQLADNAVQSGNIASGAVGSSQLDPSIGLWTASGEDVYRGGTGNVGIGKDAPTSALDVVGTVTATAFTGNGSGLTNIPASAVVGLVPETPPAGMALIPAGAFIMGNSTGDTRDADMTDAMPVSVTLSAFYMAVNEVHWSQWQTVHTWAIAHDYTFVNTGAGKSANHPVHTVNWYDVVKWCNARSEMEGLTPCYTLSGATYKTGEDPSVVCNWSANGYRLPTEAEWEKAARGGLIGQRFPWGNVISGNLANYCGNTSFSYDLGPNGYNTLGNDGTMPYTTPVGTFAANGYGINDMAGNVREWCWDWYGTPYAGGSNPHGPASGSSRVLRGGGWLPYAGGARCAFRDSYRYPEDTYYFIGFRTVLPPGQP